MEWSISNSTKRLCFRNWIVLTTSSSLHVFHHHILLLIFLCVFCFLKSQLKLFPHPVPWNTPPSRNLSLRTLSQTSDNTRCCEPGTSSPTPSFLRRSLSKHHSCVLPWKFCLRATRGKYRTEREEEDFVQNTEAAEILKKFMERHKEDTKWKSNLYLGRVTAITPLILIF